MFISDWSAAIPNRCDLPVLDIAKCHQCRKLAVLATATVGVSQQSTQAGSASSPSAFSRDW
jgi:hypothetical protein